MLLRSHQTQTGQHGHQHTQIHLTKINPFVDLHPVKMKSFLVAKKHNGLSYIFLHVIMMVAMNIQKSFGSRMPPCFTPKMLLRIWVTLQTVNLTLTFLWRNFKMIIILGAELNLFRIIHFWTHNDPFTPFMHNMIF